MIQNWENRTPIVANLLNPAFCGEILRRFIKSYNDKSEQNTPFLLCFIVLPILLHKETRDNLPKTTATHLLTWIDGNDVIFMNFPGRARDMHNYTKEALMFLLSLKLIRFQDKSEIITEKFTKKSLEGTETEEVEQIFKQAEFLGRWLAKTRDIKTLFTFLRIKP